MLAKTAALAHHGSQLGPLSPAAGDEPIVSDYFARNFRRDFETFFVAEETRAGETSAAASGPESLARSFFDSFYEGRRDPWGFETRWYEERKRALTMASLPRRRFASALEAGSSIGVLTAELARRCDALLATDIAEAPLDVARQRLADATHVRFERRELPADWPLGTFDLIVVSEVGYYLSTAELQRFIALSVGALAADGVILACHWRHPVAEYPLGGDDVHEAFAREPGLERRSSYRDDDLVLEVFARVGTPWVAETEGLL
jgi:2-polyprenyl-3-methyl-5-hydroxy-6-metoxy-1,4-benzoquinol methylase